MSAFTLFPPLQPRYLPQIVHSQYGCCARMNRTCRRIGTPRMNTTSSDRNNDNDNSTRYKSNQNQESVGMSFAMGHLTGLSKPGANVDGTPPPPPPPPPPGGDNNEGGYRGREGGDEDRENSRIVYDSGEKDAVLPRARNFPGVDMNYFTTRLTALSASFGEAATSLLTALPAQVTVAIIGIITAFMGARAQERNEQRKQEEAKRESNRRERASRIAELRQAYNSIEACILKSAYTLANRLVEIVEGERLGRAGDDGAMYSTYLMARYFACVELLKSSTNQLDLQLPAADRIFINLLGRVQGVLAANDDALKVVQLSERFFKPREGEAPMFAGVLQVSPGAQVNLGNLMLRDAEVGGTVSMNSILSYVEFCERYKAKRLLRRWCSPIRESFQRLERRQRRGKPLGARLYVTHSALIDLVEFLDPSPKCRYVPRNVRQRLRIGDAQYEEEARPPKSLSLIYKALSALRDGSGADALLRMGAEMQRAPMEVFVKANEAGGQGWGDCPYSHSVLLMLEELNVPYKAIKVSNSEKPAWFHWINPAARTPVIYHEGALISDSRDIEMYVADRFSALTIKRGLGGDDDVGRRLTRFHEVFLRWLQGESKSESERKVLDSEIRKLDAVLCAIAKRNQSEQVFFGGETFGRDDIAIVPFLYHVVVAGKELKNWKLPMDCSAVERYVSEMMKVESFQKTCANVDAIVSGYGRVLRERKDRELNLSTALE